MESEYDHVVVAYWAMDLLAAGSIAIGAGYAGWSEFPPVVVAVGAGALFVGALSLLRWIKPGAQRFALPGLTVGEVSWTQVEAVSAPPPAQPPVVQPASFTPAELRSRIRSHFKLEPDEIDQAQPSGEVVNLNADASAALRSALREAKKASL